MDQISRVTDDADASVRPSGYRYYGKQKGAGRRDPKAINASRALSLARLNPSLQNPDYLLLRARRRFFERVLTRLAGDALDVLDVGGRIQPYRPLMDHRVRRYIAVDPQMEGLTDIVAVGESLPFRDDAFNLVVCSQVLTYVSYPRKVIDEIHRVLAPGGVLLLTVPAFSPLHHDERWRFLPDGLRLLLADWEILIMESEGRSWVGAMRSAGDWVAHARLKPMRRFLVPLFNCLGRIGSSGEGSQNDVLAANFDVFARKRTEPQEYVATPEGISYIP